MNLKCYIKGKEYPVVQGCTFSEEYNETLDSGTIVITDIPKIEGLKPYDDVFIYDSNFRFDGYGRKKEIYASSLDEKNGAYIKNSSSGAILNEVGISKKIIYYLLTNQYEKYLRLYFLQVKLIGYGSENNITKLSSPITGYFSAEIEEKFSTYELTLVIYSSKNSLSARGNLKINIPKKDLYSFKTSNEYIKFSNIVFYINNDADVVRYPKFDTSYVGSLYIIDDNNDNAKFYKHMLVDSFQKTTVRLYPNKIYTYNISLFSETKKLEKIILPNISVTEPLDTDLKRSAYSYIEQFVNLYSPKVKKAKENMEWEYQKKYSLDYELISIFDDIYCPDFTLNSPSLRDVLSKIFVIKDRIPYVHDDIIYALDITKRTQTFFLDKDNEKSINYIDGSRESGSHCSTLRKTYSEGISQNNSTIRTEYLGFRNSGTPLLTLNNMRVETNFPIYKINKFYLCYYKKFNVLNASRPDYWSSDKTYKSGDIVEYNSKNYISLSNNNVSYIPETASAYWEQINEITDKAFLCKQDITKLVKLNTERNLLNQDWNDLKNDTKIRNIDDMAKYKFFTVGYEIGSKFITGWGEMIQYPNFIWDIKKSYIENVLNYVDKFSPFGVDGVEQIKEQIKIYKNQVIQTENIIDRPDYLLSYPGYETAILKDELQSPLKFKGLMFKVEYSSFFNGTLLYSKDNDDENIVSNDNPSSSLTLLESDGIYEKEKVDRLGEETIKINASYTGENNSFSNLLKLGCSYNDEDETDVVLFHREYSIFDKIIKARYVGSKDYVIKNYFTSVFARLRTWSLMDYSQSTSRAENRTMYLCLSKNNLYYEKESSMSFGFYTGIQESIKSIASCFMPTDDSSKKSQINVATIDGYSADCNCFTSGNSLCFNTRMYDNISSGVYIKDPDTEINLNVKDDYVGSVQDWWSLIDNYKTGAKKYINIYFGNKNNEYRESIPEIVNSDKEDMKKLYQEKIFVMPYIDDNYSKKIGSYIEICKDNKESIDMTFQIETYSPDKDIVVGSWSSKLSDFVTNKEKIDIDKNVQTEKKFLVNFDAAIARYETFERIPVLVLRIKRNEFDEYVSKNGQKPIITFENSYDQDKNRYKIYCYFTSSSNDTIAFFPISMQENDDATGINIKMMVMYNNATIGEKTTITTIVPFRYSSVGEDRVVAIDESQKNYVSAFYFPINGVNLVDLNEESKKLVISSSQMIFNSDFHISGTYGNDRYGTDIINADGTAAIDLQIGSDTIYAISEVVLSYKTIKKYFKNMIIIKSEKSIGKEIRNEEYYYNYDGFKDKIYGGSFSNVFNLRRENNGSEYIYINFALSGINDNVKSIQYWYLDDGVIYDNNINQVNDENYINYYKNNNAMLKFVFGVNISDEDRKRGYIRIYMSLISSKNQDVFGDNNLRIGRARNHGKIYYFNSYGNGQYYDY